MTQLIRYALVGIGSNFFVYLTYLALTFNGVAPKLTMTILYFVGAATGYIGNRNFTFTYKGNLISSGLRYFLAHCLGYGINLIILIVFVDIYGYKHQLTQAAAIFIVAIFLFLAFKFFVFVNLNESNAQKL